VWKQLLDFGKRLASLLQKMQEHEQDIKRLQQHDTRQDERIDKLTEAIQQLAFAPCS
jgi:phage shock protein A